MIDWCATFRGRAIWTAGTIRAGLVARISLLEETLTDLNLIEIAREHPDYVMTRKFNRREEGSVSGADWLWCIGEPGSWISLLIQAKAVDPRTGTCRHLDYDGGRQRRKLISFARAHRFMPLYCIYGLPGPGDIPAGSGFDADLWSCAFATPKHIATVAKRRSKCYPEILRAAVPWSEPFCAAGQYRPESGLGIARALSTSLNPHRAVRMLPTAGFPSPPEAQAQVELRRKERTDGQEIAPRRSVGQRMDWSNADPERLVSDDVPAIIKRLLAEPMRVSAAPVAQVGILSGVPLTYVLDG